MSVPVFQQQELPFSKKDKEQIKDATIRHQKAIIEALEEEIKRLRRELYGSTTERMVHGRFPLEEPEPPPPPPPPDKVLPGEVPGEKGKQPRTRRMYARYTVEVEETLIPEEVKANITAYKRLPKELDKESVRVELVPAHLRLHRYIRPAFRRIGKGDSAPIYAPAPGSILTGSNIDASIVAHMLHGKYAQHLPLYRQLQEFERLGLEGISEGVACNWVRAGADALEPLWLASHGKLMAKPALQVDETPIRCLKSDVTKGTLWAMNNPEDGMCLYYWETSRGKAVLDTLLREGMEANGKVYGGTIVTDGYEAYASWLRDQPENARPQWQNCWAHVRRKFVEGMRNSSDPAWCEKVVELIAPLYRIEKELRESKAPPEEILRRRGSESRKHVAAFFQTLEERAKDLTNPPLNNLRRAIDYAMARRERLVTWLDNPAVPIDNNGVERAIRPVAVGRQNYLFIGAPNAGKHAAILYTLVQECRRKGVDSRAWLTEVLRRLPNYRGNYLDLMPGELPLPNATDKKAQL